MCQNDELQIKIGLSLSAWHLIINVTLSAECLSNFSVTESTGSKKLLNFKRRKDQNILPIIHDRQFYLFLVVM